MLVLSPLSHAQGLLVGLVVPLSLGVSVLFSGSVDAAHVIRTVRDERVNLLLAVPHVLHLLTDTIRNSPYGRAELTVGERVAGVRLFVLRRHLLFLAVHRVLGYSLWVLLVGGARLFTEDERFWFDSGLVLVNGYGLTETSALVSLQINGPFRRSPGSIGRPLGHSDFRLAADGELLVRGATVSPGLLEPDDVGAGAVDGYFPTGDLARAAAGRYVLVGRKKDVIVTSNGMNVHPSDVEATLTSLAGVRDAVVVEAPHGPATRIHAVLLLEDGIDAGGAVRQANIRLEPHQRIAEWSVWPDVDFPRSSLAKVRRVEVAQRIVAPVDPATPEATAAWRDTGSVPPPPLSAIRQVGDRHRRIELLRDHLLRGQPSEDEADTKLIEDLGLSSLDTIELLASLEAQQPFAFEPTSLTADDTLADVRAKLTGAHQARSQSAAPPRMDRPWFRFGQRVLAPMVLGVWTTAVARVETVGGEHLAGIAAPVVVACGHHEHGCDVLLIRRALPGRLRRRLLVVTTRWLFGEYLDGVDAPTPRRRAFVAGAFHVGLPLLMPFALWPARHFAISGLAETGRLIGRGYCPLVFPETAQRLLVDPGVGLIAEQTKAAVIPVWLEGNEGITLRPTRRRRRVVVLIGPPIRPAVGEGAATITERVRHGLGAIASPTDVADDTDVPDDTDLTAR
jgi:long-chain acyl-CoA synthetase